MLNLISFISMNVAPAFAQFDTSYSAPVATPYSPPYMAPLSAYDPALILQTIGQVPVYNQSGLMGYLPSDSYFETPVYGSMFHNAVANMNYNALFGAAYQVPTAYGQMVPATMVDPMTLSNGIQMSPESQFYIPSSDFSYDRLRAIGASSSYENSDVNRFLDQMLPSMARSGDNDTDNFDDEDREDSGRSRVIYQSRREREDREATGSEESDEDDELYLDTAETEQRIVRQSEIQAPRTGSPTTTSRTQTQSQTRPEPRPAPPVVLNSNEPFSVIGPTCDCRSVGGRACVIGSSRGQVYGAARPGRTHAGVDITGPVGSPIIAAFDGVVKRAQVAGGYGKLVELDHAGGYSTRYGHMSRIAVRPGQRVRRGQIIGYLGSTGRSSGPHVHFEVRKNGRPQNPNQYLRQTQERQLNSSCSSLAPGAVEAGSTTTSTQRTNTSRTAR